MSEKPDGLDFFFSTKNHAIKFVDFLNTIAPIRTKTSQELISSDLNSNTYNFKFTFSVEIVPICKDDLICFPNKWRSHMAQMGSLAVCHKVGTTLHFIDPSTLAVGEVVNQAYWKQSFPSLSSTKELTEYMILDIEPLGPTRGKYVLANVQVARVSDLGQNDVTFLARTHLGHLFQAGDIALGYDMTRSNFNNEDYEKLNHKELPDVILVKKSYAEKRKKNRSRNWQLKRLEDGTQTFGYEKKKDAIQAAGDFEEFIQDLEEDNELRQGVNLYKNPNYVAPLENEMDEGENEDDGYPDIPLEELLDDMTLDDPDQDPDDDDNNGDEEDNSNLQQTVNN